MINFPDLCQRFLSAHSVRLCENTNYLVTRESIDTMAGLFGMIYNLFGRDLQ